MSAGEAVEVVGEARPDDLTWPEVHRALIPLMRADNVTNAAFVAFEYLLLAVALGGCAWLYREWTVGAISSVAFWPLAVVGMFAVAVVQHRLSGLGHEAGHYTLFKNKFANEFVSDVLLMFPTMAMTQRFRATHNDHHRFVNDPARDPDVVRLNRPWPARFPMAKSRFVGRYLVRGLWLPELWAYLFGQAKNANVGGPEMKAVYRFRVGRVLRGTYWISVLTVVHLLNAWPIFWLFWVLPLVTFYAFLMQLREIAHHSNAPDDGDFTNSRLFFVGGVARACIFPYGQDYHLTHHLFAMLPHYRMAQAHEILLRYAPYREQIVICRGYFWRWPWVKGPTVLDVVSA